MLLIRNFSFLEKKICAIFFPKSPILFACTSIKLLMIKKKSYHISMVLYPLNLTLHICGLLMFSKSHMTKPF